ncbi:MAG: hypothetical protein ACI9GH_000349 [Candidatus Paceibacteria bacterium]|jgi:hypothetical protein
MTQKKKDQILVFLGRMFTENFVNEQENDKIKSFKRSAEHCRKMIKRKREDIRNIAVAISIAAIIVYTGMNSGYDDIYTRITTLGAAGIVIFVGTLHYINRITSIGRTTKIVARAWEGKRKMILNTGLISNITTGLSERPALAESSTPVDENQVGIALQGMLAKLAEKIRYSEVEGLDYEKDKARKQIVKITSLADSFGYESNDWGAFFNPKSTSRSLLRKTRTVLMNIK